MLRDDAGNVLRVSLGKGDADCRPWYSADADDWIVKALVASEDGEFWTHCGVRPLSVARAAFQNIAGGRRVSGASTITMQAVRLIRPHPKTFWWKWKEAVMALKMERMRSKEWILTQYLNRAPFGSNFIGIEAAAQGWLGKGAKELGLGEAAMLAGMVQAPSRFRPDRHYDRALRRRDYVLGRMLKLGMINEGQLEGAKTVEPNIRRAPRPFLAPHFCDWVLGELGGGGAAGVRALPGRHGGACGAAGVRALPGRHGDITTTLNADIQAVCENAVNAASREGGYSVAAVVMAVRSGDVKALACSGDYFDGDGGQVNTAVAPRPAGSTLKPFLTALAIDRGVISPNEKLCDVPVAYRGYRPANFDGRHRGLVSVRDALVLSLSIPFVQMLRRTGVETFGNCLRGLGFRHVGADDAAGLGMAIGNVEVSLMELVRAYGVIARGGVAARLESAPYRAAGSDAEAARPESAPYRMAGACYLISEMLSGGERAQAALGHVADVRASRFAWKTGTSSAYRDAWTIAWNPEYVVGVWCGHKAGRFGDRTVVGAKAAAPVAWSIARALYPQNDGPWFERPREVVRRRVCSLTGLAASADCPETDEGWVVAGKTPSVLCAVHRRDAAGNVVVRTDAAFAAFAGLAGKAEGLTILKPEDGAVFRLVGHEVGRAARPESAPYRMAAWPESTPYQMAARPESTPYQALQLQQQIVCQVAGNPEGAKLWWFVDGRPAGESVGLQPMALPMTVGAHEVTCATAEGVSSTVRVMVRE